MGNDTYIVSEEAPHNNFTMIPNIVDEMDLTPYAYRLYGHIRRVAGENGACWEGTATLAEKCHMSTGMVSKVKKELVKVGLIRIEKRSGQTGKYDHITILNVWSLNHAHFHQSDPGKPSRDERSPAKRSPHEHQCSQGERERSCGETNKISRTRSRDQDKPDDDDARGRAREKPIDTTVPDSGKSETRRDNDPVLAEVSTLYEQEIGGTMSPLLFDELLELTAQERDLKRWRKVFRASLGKYDRWAWIKAVITNPKGGAKRPASRRQRKKPKQRVAQWDGQDQGTTDESILDGWGD